ncbi:hypothetical protein SDC9_201802 [bioreactor metagenome]|uniref:Uncharacterized protein n=1 Tax=bioreactor metagenome TaxID=1076179 RepID=A0A645J3S0_9ZZZZ
MVSLEWADSRQFHNLQMSAGFFMDQIDLAGRSDLIRPAQPVANVDETPPAAKRRLSYNQPAAAESI